MASIARTGTIVRWFVERAVTEEFSSAAPDHNMVPVQTTWVVSSTLKLGFPLPLSLSLRVGRPQAVGANFQGAVRVAAFTDIRCLTAQGS